MYGHHYAVFVRRPRSGFSGEVSLVIQVGPVWASKDADPQPFINMRDNGFETMTAWFVPKGD